MVGFAFDVPQVDLGYQARERVHVIREVSPTALTPLKVAEVEQAEGESGKGRKVIEVYFPFDSAEFLPGEVKKLRLFVKGDKVVVIGHASPEGSDEYNLRLSLRRAKATERELKKLGVEVVHTEGKGERECKEKPLRWHKCRKAVVMEADR